MFQVPAVLQILSEVHGQANQQLGSSGLHLRPLPSTASNGQTAREEVLLTRKGAGSPDSGGGVES